MYTYEMVKVWTKTEVALRKNIITRTDDCKNTSHAHDSMIIVQHKYTSLTYLTNTREIQPYVSALFLYDTCYLDQKKKDKNKQKTKTKKPKKKKQTNKQTDI